MRTDLFGLGSKERMIEVAQELMGWAKKGDFRVYDSNHPRLNRHPVALIHEMLQKGPISYYEIPTYPEELQALTRKETQELLERAHAGRFEGSPVRDISFNIANLTVRVRDGSGESPMQVKIRSVGLKEGELTRLLKQEREALGIKDETDAKEGRRLSLAAG